MTKYHIAQDGKPAKCSATTRACPLGGEHYESQREAMDAVNDRAFDGETDTTADNKPAWLPDDTLYDDFDWPQLHDFSSAPSEWKVAIMGDEVLHYELTRGYLAKASEVNGVSIVAFNVWAGEKETYYPNGAADLFARQMEWLEDPKSAETVSGWTHKQKYEKALAYTFADVLDWCGPHNRM